MSFTLFAEQVSHGQLLRPDALGRDTLRIVPLLLLTSFLSNLIHRSGAHLNLVTYYYCHLLHPSGLL